MHPPGDENRTKREGRARAAWLLGLLGALGCFGPSLGDEPFLCGTGGACPPGYRCDERQLCVRAGAIPADGPTGPDAAVVDGPLGPDARLADARVDARPVPDAPPGTPDAACTPGSVTGCVDTMTASLCGGGTQGCAFRCDPGARLCQQCDPSQPSFCAAPDGLGSCTAAGALGPVVPCSGFCTSSGGPPACVTLEPANLPAGTCTTASTRTRHVTAMLELDTDTCSDGQKVQQTGPASPTPPPICLVVYADLIIDAGAGFHVTGSAALALVATHDLVLNGTLDATAAGQRNGPGVPAPPPGLGKTVSSGYVPGGGGGGYGQGGAGGGTESDDGAIAGGASYGGPEDVPLQGGSPGGAGGSPPTVCDLNCPTIGQGGGGGGAVLLAGCHKLGIGTLGRVLAGGGGGRGGFFVAPGIAAVFVPATAGGGGGGGAGGAIVLEGGQVGLGDFAVVTATGGGGGGGGTFGLLPAARGGDGENGGFDHPAQGGSPGAAQAGRGGYGSLGPRTDALTPGPGLAAQAPAFGAGGGGGAIGRIRIDTSPDQPFQPGGLLVVPVPSTGAVRFHR